MLFDVVEVDRRCPVFQESQVIFRITKVITSPMIGSAMFAPSPTAIALPTTPSETKPSTRA